MINISVQPTFSIKSQNTLQMSYTLHSVLVCVCVCVWWTRSSTKWLHACLVDKRQHKMGLSCATASWMTQRNHPIERDLSHSMIKTWPLTVNVRLAEAGCISKATLCDYKLSWSFLFYFLRGGGHSKVSKLVHITVCCTASTSWSPQLLSVILTSDLQESTLQTFPKKNILLDYIPAVFVENREAVQRPNLPPQARVYSCLIPPVLLIQYLTWSQTQPAAMETHQRPNRCIFVTHACSQLN